MGLNKVLLLATWILKEPALWRVSSLVFIILLFSSVSTVARPTGTGDLLILSSTLSSTATRVVGTAYPFLFALVSILATLAVAIQRETGGLAALQVMGFHRWQVLLASSLSVLVLVLVPSLLALVLLPPVVEPGLASTGSIHRLYPIPYWTSMPRLFMAVVFLSLFAVAFALMIRRPAVAFGAMISFFFIGWFLQGPLGAYALVTPPGAFRAAYVEGLVTPEGMPLDGAIIFLLHLLAAAITYGGALVYASRKGEFA